MVAPITLSPTVLRTGIDSPVRSDSSTELLPYTTTPSTGTFEPGKTFRRCQRGHSIRHHTHLQNVVLLYQLGWNDGLLAVVTFAACSEQRGGSCLRISE